MTTITIDPEHKDGAAESTMERTFLHYAVDASEIPLRPGSWPAFLYMHDDGEADPLRLARHSTTFNADGGIEAVLYHAEDGTVLRVLND